MSALVNIEAEQALLGRCLTHPDTLSKVNGLEPQAFSEELHGGLFDLMRQLAAKEIRPTPITMKAFLDRAPLIGDLTAAQYLARLVTSSTGFEDVPSLVAEIEERAKRRKLSKLKETIEVGLNDASVSISEITEYIMKETAALRAVEHDTREAAVLDTVSDVVERAALAYEAGGRPKGVRTGFGSLDAMLSGFKPGQMIVLAGRPSMGKTAIAINMARAIAQGGEKVAFLSMEMTLAELGTRILADLAGISAQAIENGAFNQDDYMRMLRARDACREMPLILDETSRVTPSIFLGRANEWVRKDVKLLMLDYLQLMSADDRGRSRYEQITDISGSLKQTAKSLGVPLVVLAQLSRENEKRASKRPLLADLRDSGAIEQDADVVMFIHRDEYYTSKAQPTSDTGSDEYLDWQDKLRAEAGKASLIIAKNRSGPTGEITLNFNQELMRFSDA